MGACNLKILLHLISTCSMEILSALSINSYIRSVEGKNSFLSPCKLVLLDDRGKAKKKTLEINRKSLCIKIVSGKKTNRTGFSSVQCIQPETHSHQFKPKERKNTKQKLHKKPTKNNKTHKQTKLQTK